MSYIKLKIRSGGIYIRQKKDFQPIDLDLIDHPDSNTQKVLSLVRGSSIKGLFSYLMGETKKLEFIESSKDFSIKKLALTLEAMQQSSVFRKISEPHTITFFERKDTHHKLSHFTSNPKINLYQYSFETADPTIKLLEVPLRRIIEKEKPIYSLGDIHSSFKENIIKYNNAEPNNEYEILIKKAYKLDKELESKIPSANTNLKSGIKIALKWFSDQKPISKKVITLIEEIYFLCNEDKKFYEKLKNSNVGKFSVFTDLNNIRQWVDTKYHSIVRGTPSFIAQVDFDVYLSEGAFEENKKAHGFSWEEILNKLRNGPNIARWGEGGVVLVCYKGLEEMGRGCDENDKDQMFVEISSLRKSGMKIKKYHWEATKNNNKKIKSNI